MNALIFTFVENESRIMPQLREKRIPRAKITCPVLAKYLSEGVQIFSYLNYHHARERCCCDACESGRDTVVVLGVLWLRNRFRFLTGYDNLYNRFVTINKKMGGVHAEAQVARGSQRSAASQKL